MSPPAAAAAAAPAAAAAAAAPAEPAPYPALFHLGYSLPADLQIIRARFSGVKYVLLAGSNTRAALLGETFRALQSDSEDSSNDADEPPPPLPNLCTTGRYMLVQPSPAVLAASHGIGKGSADTLLHELTSLLRVAGATEYSYIRTGSCGGCGVAPGSLVVSDAVVNGEGKSAMRAVVLGQVRHYPALVCKKLTEELRRAAEAVLGDGKVVVGTTMACDTFYEEQGRLDGALCGYGPEEQTAFLRRCRDDLGVRNFEMESLTLAAFCARAAIPCGVMCAVLVDRMGGAGDTPTAPEKQLRDWEAQPVRVAAQYVFEQLRKGGESELS
jgi:uridine phosphorylase